MRSNLGGRVRGVACVASALMWVGMAQAATAQTEGPCGKPPVAARDAQPNIFNDQQEAWLGEAMADFEEGLYRPVKDESQSAYLQAIVDRLAATLPPLGFKFKVMLVDSPEINAYSIAGGHIYVMRKLAAAAKSEDEMASVLGHEIGHIASHQFAFETTRDLKRLLNITSVGDRDDVYKKFQLLMDARMKDKHPEKRSEEKEKEDDADTISIYAIAAAGYRPQAYAEFWDRVFFVGGKTGDRLTDFFGLTKPDEKRLRLMQKVAAALPAGCGAAQKQAGLGFAEWHAKVLANQAVELAASESALREVTLDPPLHTALDRLRFSHDGKYILAQDEGSVFVMSAQPLAVLFRIDATDALDAEFSPDSQRVTFSTAALHTEEWSIAEKKLLAAHEVVTPAPCQRSKLSPDARTLLCASTNSDDEHVDLALLDTVSGEKVWSKPKWMALSASVFYFAGLEIFFDPFPIRPSPDGNVLMGGEGQNTIAFDLRTRTEIKLGGELKKPIFRYGFVTSDKMAVANNSDSKKSGIYSFPDGRLLKPLAITLPNLESVTGAGDDPIVLSRGVGDFAILEANLETQKVTGLKTAAMDVYNGQLTGETADGGVAVQPQTGATVKPQKVVLPLSPLGRLRSVVMSRDGKYIALSTHTQGAVWDVETGKRIILLHGFTGAQWADGDLLYADFPKHGTIERHIAEIIAPAKAAVDMTYKLENDTVMRYGRLVEWKSAKNISTLSVHSAKDGSVLWTKSFPQGRPFYTASGMDGEGELLFAYSIKNADGKAQLNADPALAALAAAIKDKTRGVVVEVTDAATGTVLKKMVVDVALDFDGVDSMNVAGDMLYAGGKANRTLVYSMTTGQQVRQVFGHVISIDKASKRVCISNRNDEAIVFDEAGNEVSHLHTGSAIRFARFREKGTQLILLTADQKVRTFDLSKEKMAAAK